MTTGAAVDRVATGRGDDPASTVDPSAAALAANARLEELRRAAGIATRQRLAGDGLDQSAASTSRPQSRPLEDDRGNGGRVEGKSDKLSDLTIALEDDRGNGGRVEPGHVLKMTGATAAASSRGQAALEARRRELGIKYRRPGAGLDQSADWSAWAAGKSAASVDLDQSAAGLDGRGDVGAQRLDQGRGVDAAASTVGLSPALASLTAAALTVTRARPSPAGDDLDHAAASTSRPQSRPLEDDRGAAVAGMVGAQTLDAADQLAGVTATVYPRLAAAMLEAGQARAARLWLLMLASEPTRRGAYDLDAVYRTFAGKGSAWAIGGRRCVQQILKAGAGIFWTRDSRGRLWRHGPASVAAALGMVNTVGAPQLVPVVDLLGGMQSVRAALFNASMATHDAPRGQAVLEGLTGACPNSQRAYRRTAGIEALPQIRFIPGATDQAGLQDAYWQHGRSVFVFTDHDGRRGHGAGAQLLAKRDPNAYTANCEPARRGRTKKINKKLNLVCKGARGNESTVDYKRLYFKNAAAAGSAYNRGRGRRDCAYQLDQSKTVGFWDTIDALPGAGL